MFSHSSSFGDVQHTGLTEQRVELICQLAEVECSLKRCEIERADCMPVNVLPNEILYTILRCAFQHDRRECIMGEAITSANPIPILSFTGEFAKTRFSQTSLKHSFIVLVGLVHWYKREMGRSQQ